MKPIKESKYSDKIISKTLSVNDVRFTHADIQNVVDAFYRKVQFDDLLKIPFRSVHDWPEHIDRLTHFWWLRFGGKAYMLTHYHPVTKHFHAGFNKDLLARWLKLFHQTLAEHLNEQQCQIWTLLSNKMGQGLTVRNEMYRKAIEDEKQSTRSSDDERT